VAVGENYSRVFEVEAREKLLNDFSVRLKAVEGLRFLFGARPIFRNED
jgi:hypothetical protein